MLQHCEAQPDNLWEIHTKYKTSIVQNNMNCDRRSLGCCTRYHFLFCAPVCLASSLQSVIYHVSPCFSTRPKTANKTEGSHCDCDHLYWFGISCTFAPLLVIRAITPGAVRGVPFSFLGRTSFVTVLYWVLCLYEESASGTSPGPEYCVHYFVQTQNSGRKWRQAEKEMSALHPKPRCWVCIIFLYEVLFLHDSKRQEISITRWQSSAGEMRPSIVSSLLLAPHVLRTK